MAVDPVSQCVVKLALDSEFSQKFSAAANEDERRTVIEEAFPDMETGQVDAFVRRDAESIAEFVFNQQTSGVASSHSIAGALRVLLAAVESGKKQI